MLLLSFHIFQDLLFLLLYFTVLSILVPIPYILSVYINTWFYASYMKKLTIFPLTYENIFTEFTAIKLNPKFNILLVPFPFFSKWVTEILKKKKKIQYFHYFTVKPLNTEAVLFPGEVALLLFKCLLDTVFFSAPFHSSRWFILYPPRISRTWNSGLVVWFWNEIWSGDLINLLFWIVQM